MDEYEVAIREAEEAGMKIEPAPAELVHVKGHLVSPRGVRLVLWKDPIIPDNAAKMVRRFATREVRLSSPPWARGSA